MDSNSFPSAVVASSGAYAWVETKLRGALWLCKQEMIDEWTIEKKVIYMQEQKSN